MPKNNNVISITDMTQKAYDRIIQEELAKKTLQQYWYCGVVPVRRYCEQRGIEVYSPESINDCVIWFREQYKQGVIYPAKFRTTRKVAEIMESIAAGGSYQWQAQTPWYIVELPAPYRALLEDYAQHRRKNGCREASHTNHL